MAIQNPASRLFPFFRGCRPLSHPNRATVEGDRLAVSDFSPDAVLDRFVHFDLTVDDHPLGHSAGIAQTGCFQEFVEFDVVSGYFKYFQKIRLSREG